MTSTVGVAVGVAVVPGDARSGDVVSSRLLGWRFAHADGGANSNDPFTAECAYSLGLRVVCFAARPRLTARRHRRSVSLDD